MSTTVYNPFAAGVDQVRGSWGWFLFLGITLTILGVASIVFEVTATFATVLVFGWLLLVSGTFQLVNAFRTGTWTGLFLYLLSALFRGFTGYLLVRYPVMGAESLTLVLASFFIVGGLFRAIGYGMARFPNWGWAVLSGLVSVALGVMVLSQLPAAGIWFIGFAVGVDLIFDGLAVSSFGAAIHQLPTRSVFA